MGITEIAGLMTAIENAYQEVAKNAIDPDADPLAKRGFVISVDLIPNEKGIYELAAKVKLNIAGAAPISTFCKIVRRGDDVEIFEQTEFDFGDMPNNVRTLKRK